MQLHDYISQERGRLALLARQIGAHVPDVSRWANGTRPVPDRYALAIEKATEGVVTRRDLCPDTWQFYWPELKEPEHA